MKGRVTKTEERMEMEQKSMTQVLSQAKQVELQLATQQEGMVNRETQLVLQLQKIQEDVSVYLFLFCDITCLAMHLLLFIYSLWTIARKIFLNFFLSLCYHFISL